MVDVLFFIILSYVGILLNYYLLTGLDNKKDE